MKSSINYDMVKKFLFLLACFLMISWNIQKNSVFLIGDSISIEYWPYLKEYIADFALLERKQDDGEALKNLDTPMGANGGDSRMALLYLESKLKESGFKPDYMVINCGLHDIKRDPITNDIQINENEYKNNISKIFRTLKEKNIKPIWINTTFVMDTIHNTKSKAFSRYDADVIKYNKIAEDICKKQNVPIIDLYSFSKGLGEKEVRDHVHFNQNTQKLQAAYIAGFLQRHMNNR